MKELATQYPGILDPYFAKENARGGPTSLFWLAPNPLLDSLAALSIEVPFHSIIGNRGINEGANSTDGIVDYKSSHLPGAESEKIVPAGHNLIANSATVAEIKRILEENIVGRDRHRPKWSNWSALRCKRTWGWGCRTPEFKRWMITKWSWRFSD
jgi:hypothetical protein